MYACDVPRTMMWYGYDDDYDTYIINIKFINSKKCVEHSTSVYVYYMYNIYIYNVYMTDILAHNIRKIIYFVKFSMNREGYSTDTQIGSWTQDTAFFYCFSMLMITTPFKLESTWGTLEFGQEWGEISANEIFVLPFFKCQLSQK